MCDQTNHNLIIRIQQQCCLQSQFVDMKDWRSCACGSLSSHFTGVLRGELNAAGSHADLLKCKLMQVAPRCSCRMVPEYLAGTVAHIECCVQGACGSLCRDASVAQWKET